MSLFENDEYRWRETCFVLFHTRNRPQGDRVVAALREVNEHYEVTNVLQTEDGLFESLTLLSPDDYAAMDITFVTGEEVREHSLELVEEMAPMIGRADEKKLKSLPEFDARLDVYHFEQIVFAGSDTDDDEEEFLDPGSLLIVLEKLASLTEGVGVDQESGTLL